MPRYRDHGDDKSTQPFVTSSMDLFLDSEYERPDRQIHRKRRKKHKLLTPSERDVYIDRAVDPFEEFHNHAKTTQTSEQEHVESGKHRIDKSKQTSKEVDFCSIHNFELFDNELIGNRPKKNDRQSGDDSILTGAHQKYGCTERHRARKKSKHETGDVVNDSSSRRDKKRQEISGSAETSTHSAYNLHVECHPASEHYSVHSDEFCVKEECGNTVCKKMKKKHKSKQVFKESLSVSWENLEDGQAPDLGKEEKQKTRSPHKQKAGDVALKCKLEISNGGSQLSSKSWSSSLQTMYSGEEDVDQNFSDFQDCKLDTKCDVGNRNAKVSMASEGADCMSGISQKKAVIKDTTNSTNKQFSTDKDSDKNCLESTQSTNNCLFKRRKRNSLEDENIAQNTNDHCRKKKKVKHSRDEEEDNNVQNDNDSSKQKKRHSFTDGEENSVKNTKGSSKKKKSFSDKQENSIQMINDGCKRKRKRQRSSGTENEKNSSYTPVAEGPPSTESKSKALVQKKGNRALSEPHMAQLETLPPATTKNSHAAQPSVRSGVTERQNLVRQQCYLCGIDVCSNHDYKEHLSAMHGKTVYQCSRCGRACSSANGLELHRSTACKGTFSMVRVYCCRRCPMSYNTYQGLWRHKKEQHKIGRAVKEYACRRCNKLFSRQQNLVEHQASSVCTKRGMNNDESQQSANPCTCDICQKEFASKRSLRYHMDTIHEHKQFECRICGQIFRWSKSLSRHMLKCG